MGRFRNHGRHQEFRLSEFVPGRATPARVYLFKDGKPFRLSPVDVLLPLRVDLRPLLLDLGADRFQSNRTPAADGWNSTISA